jgi:aminoglycoside phosphotransferase (APT) family kinase protein
MSPGPASRIVLESGARFFVKAVGTELNVFTPRLFRREVAVLRSLADVDYRPALVTDYDDGDWVAIVLEDVEGTHPDLDDPATMTAVRDVVRRQTVELMPSPVETHEPDLAATAVRWAEEIRSASVDARAELPQWWRDREEELIPRIDSLPAQLPTECFCHLDIRDDNLLVRSDGSVVVLDWGMSRPGPAWVDEVLLDLHVVTAAVFDANVDAYATYPGTTQSPRERSTAVTDLLLTMGTSLAIQGRGASHGLPHLSEFRRREAVRLLSGAARRLGISPSGRA